MIPQGNHLSRPLALNAFQKPLGGRSLERRDQPPRDTHTHTTHAKDTEDDGRPQRAHRFLPCLRPVLCTYLRGNLYKNKTLLCPPVKYVHNTCCRDTLRSSAPSARACVRASKAFHSYMCLVQVHSPLFFIRSNRDMSRSLPSSRTGT